MHGRREVVTVRSPTDARKGLVNVAVDDVLHMDLQAQSQVCTGYETCTIEACQHDGHRRVRRVGNVRYN